MQQVTLLPVLPGKIFQRAAGAARRVRRVRVKEDFLQRFQHRDGVREDAVRQQEGVQKVDVEEAEVGQSLKEPLRGGVADLGNLGTRTVQRILFNPASRVRM